MDTPSRNPFSSSQQPSNSLSPSAPSFTPSLSRAHASTAVELPTHRELCLRCRRPRSVCYCAHIPTLETRTRVVFLQHVRERYMPIGTARMAHLALPNSEFHVGVDFSEEPWANALADEPGTFILFPGENSRDLSELAPGELKKLVVVDGTWPLARKLIKVNPALQRIPQVGFRPARPGNYRIRKEPAEHCLSTIEAVSEILGVLEGDAERFRQMLRAFDAMIDAQIGFRDNRSGPSRYASTTKKPKQKPNRATKVADELRGLGERLVLVYAESNSISEGDEHRHELIHLTALRPSTGERFETLMRPAGALAENTPRHLELTAEEIVTGEDRADGLRRWESFVRGDDVFAGWGYYAWALIRPTVADHATFIDLRERLIRVVRQKPGGLDEAAGLSSAPLEGARGRAGRRLVALERVLQSLIRPASAA